TLRQWSLSDELDPVVFGGIPRDHVVGAVGRTVADDHPSGWRGCLSQDGKNRLFDEGRLVPGRRDENVRGVASAVRHACHIVRAWGIAQTVTVASAACRWSTAIRPAPPSPPRAPFATACCR